MKTLLFAVFWAALCVQVAHCLVCYECDLQSNNANCLTINTCLYGADSYCMTAVTNSIIMGPQITKQCTEECAPGSISIFNQDVTVTCCSSDLCNFNAVFNGAAGTMASKAGFAVLAPTAVLIGLLFTY
ncbi:lymphocyte antigen 6E-like [Lissotriton helveticus]